MRDVLEFDGFKIERVFFDKEINFIITNEAGYFCRLVPGENGFELSKHDRSMGNEPAPNILVKLSELILSADE